MNQEHAYRRHLTKDEIARASYNWTEPVKSGPIHSATADYLGLDRSLWVGTTIDNDGYREDYITDKVLYELVEQLAEDLATAETDKDRDRLLDRHLDVLDAWGKPYPSEPEHRYLVQETGSPDGTIWTEAYETLQEAKKVAAGAEYINQRDKTGREVKLLYVEKTEKYYMTEDLEGDPFDWVNWFSADDVEDRPVPQITLKAAGGGHPRRRDIGMKNIGELKQAIANERPRSAWGRGVKEYAEELAEELEEAIRGGYYTEDKLTDRAALKAQMLNGAESWSQYSWGGCSLMYDGDIAERLCAPSELKKVKGGERRPNSREEWLDVQARALTQAASMIIRLARA